MEARTLEDWLAYQQRVHPHAMDFTLGRMHRVLPALGLGRPARHVITVGGTNDSGDTMAPLMRQRSSKCTRCGLMYRPTRQPDCSAMHSSIAQVEPLPLVPATLITGALNFRPRRSRTSATRSSVMSMVLGCRASQWASHCDRVLGMGVGEL